MNVVKALPALVIEEAEIRRFAAALEDVVARRRSDGRRGHAGSAGTSRAAARARCCGEGARHGGEPASSARTSSPRLWRPAPSVRGFDAREPAALPAGAEFARGDVLDADALRRALAECDAVVHVAALYSYRPADAAAMERVNVEGTRAVLEAAGSRRIVHTSSCATCGPVARPRGDRGRRARGLGAARPLQAHEAGRRAARARARARRDVVVVNPTTPVGPGDLRPTPDREDGRRRRAAGGRARYLAGSALNVVAVEDVARGHAARARARARRPALPARRRESRDARRLRGDLRRGRAAAHRGSRCRGAPPTRRRGSPGCLRPDPSLLVLDEVRVARWPMRFDDSRARRELGYASEPARGRARARSPCRAASCLRPAPGPRELLARARPRGSGRAGSAGRGGRRSA